MKKTLTAIVMCLLLSAVVGTNGFAQQRQYTGTVLSSDGQPVKLASIQVIGTNRGTTANDQGEFKIDATPGEELQVSSIGFLTSKIKVAPEKKNKIILKNNL